MIRQMNPLLYSIIVTFLLTNFISSCSKNEDTLLNDEKFVEVLADLMIIEKIGIPEYERIQYAKAVFKKHKIDTTIYYRTRRFYEANEEYWIKIYMKTKIRIQTKLDSIDILKEKPKK